MRKLISCIAPTAGFLASAQASIPSATGMVALYELKDPTHRSPPDYVLKIVNGTNGWCAVPRSFIGPKSCTYVYSSAGLLLGKIDERVLRGVSPLLIDHAELFQTVSGERFNFITYTVQVGEAASDLLFSKLTIPTIAIDSVPPQFKKLGKTITCYQVRPPNLPSDSKCLILDLPR